MPTEYLAKVISNDENLIIKLPKEIIDKNQIQNGSYVQISISQPKEYIIELEKPIIEELTNMSLKWEIYKGKNINDILKDIMFKFNNGEQNINHIPSKDIKIIEKGKF